MEYREQIEQIKATYLKGKISYEEAKNKVEALLVIMNEKGAKIAKKFGKNYKKLTFGYIFR